MTRKPHILFVPVTVFRAGTEQIVLDLAERFGRDGYPISLAIPTGHPSLDRMAQESDALGAQTHRVGPLHPGDRNIRENFRVLTKLFKETKPDIVHLHMPYAPLCFESVVAAYRARVPVRIRTEQNPLGPLSAKQRLKMRVLDAMVHKIVFVSNSNREEHIQRGRAMGAKAMYIGNGINPSTIAHDCSAEVKSAIRKRLQLPEKAVIAVMVGTLEHRKGPIDFVKAARVAAQQNPDIHFAVIGDGDKRTAAEEMTKEYGLTERIHFLGRRADVREILCAFDIFVQPSHYEGMSIAMLEALAAGLPMASTRVAGVSDVFPNEEGALCVDVYDTEGLGGAIAQYAADPARRTKDGANSHNRILEAFTQEHIYQEYRTLFSKMSGGNRLNGSEG